MLNILFCHAKKNEALSYKQVWLINGMTPSNQSNKTEGTGRSKNFCKILKNKMHCRKILVKSFV